MFIYWRVIIHVINRGKPDNINNKAADSIDTCHSFLSKLSMVYSWTYMDSPQYNKSIFADLKWLLIPPKMVNMGCGWVWFIGKGLPNDYTQVGVA